MDALTYLRAKFGIPAHATSPIEIPHVKRDPDLCRLFHLLGYQVGVEVGVEQGLFSEALCRENPGVRLYCVDAWRAYRGYRDHVDQEKLNGFYEATQRRLAPYRATLIREFSLDAVKDFQDGELDFVYIDGNHSFENVAMDIAAWSRKVRVGGIIAGHDYAKYQLPNMIHVVQAVNGYIDAYEIDPWFLLGKQSKTEDPDRDKARSWFWVHDPKPIRPRGQKAIKQ